MAKVESIPAFQGPAAEAFAAATQRREPVLVSIPLFSDDRGWSIMNQLQGVLSPGGQLNVSLQYPGVIKAWHRHQLQTDFWICVRGEIKVGVHREDDRAWMAVIGEHRPSLVIIPPSLWHGAATVGHEPASLLYYVTHAYNAAKPDEERRAFDVPAWFSWTPQPR